eukprot:TRINITY_DN1348_c0_g1_i1.p1 TRINITY_DN1348_c0_g1~~TRINITY_DN1348_c0_g1_i1.p1  ORF type:complete len:924 (-),score=286.60 TRINITY_DN1348_c0_g1_i1:477-3248(-)
MSGNGAEEDFEVTSNPMNPTPRGGRRRRMTIRMNDMMSTKRTLEKQALQVWFEQALNVKINGNLTVALKSGVLLCRLISLIDPSLNVKFNRSRLPFKKIENITFFLKACDTLGVKPTFEPFDLYENKNENKVVLCLLSLGEMARSRGFEPALDQIPDDVSKIELPKQHTENDRGSPRGRARGGSRGRRARGRGMRRGTSPSRGRSPSRGGRAGLRGAARGGRSGIVLQKKQCAACDKTINPVELKRAGTMDLHANCFKCSKCGEKLTTETFVCKDEELFCQQHGNEPDDTKEIEKQDAIAKETADYSAKITEMKARLDQTKRTRKDLEKRLSTVDPSFDIAALEKEEQQRLQKQKEEAERIRKEEEAKRLEEDRKDREEAQRLQKEQEQKARLAKEKLEAEKKKLEEEKKRQEEELRQKQLALEKAEKERLAEQKRLAEEAEKKRLAEEAEKKRLEEELRKSKEELERRNREAEQREAEAKRKEAELQKKEAELKAAERQQQLERERQAEEKRKKEEEARQQKLAAESKAADQAAAQKLQQAEKMRQRLAAQAKQLEAQRKAMKARFAEKEALLKKKEQELKETAKESKYLESIEDFFRAMYKERYIRVFKPKNITLESLLALSEKEMDEVASEIALNDRRRIGENIKLLLDGKTFNDSKPISEELRKKVLDKKNSQNGADAQLEEMRKQYEEQLKMMQDRLQQETNAKSNLQSKLAQVHGKQMEMKMALQNTERDQQQREQELREQMERERSERENSESAALRAEAAKRQAEEEALKKVMEKMDKAKAEQQQIWGNASRISYKITAGSAAPAADAKQNLLNMAMYGPPFGNTVLTVDADCWLVTDRKSGNMVVLAINNEGIRIVEPFTEDLIDVHYWKCIKEWGINSTKTMLIFTAKYDEESDYVSKSVPGQRGRGYFECYL